MPFAQSDYYSTLYREKVTALSTLFVPMLRNTLECGVKSYEQFALRKGPVTAVTLNLEPLVLLTDDAFYALCQANPEVKFERTANGELIVMPPTGGETGNRNIELAFQLQAWSRQNNLGVAFDSSTMFQLPNGAYRSPDAAWILLTRWSALTLEERKIFPPLCPDFVVELRSPSDSLKAAQNKMQEYIDNGARLGWLLNPKGQQVEIYRQGQEKEILPAPTHLSGEQVLPGFVLELKGIL